MKGENMRNIFAGFCLFMFMSAPAFASSFILNYYDNTFYPEGDAATAGMGELVGISDIYYSWNLLNGTLTSTQTEWIADGNGGMVKAPYDSSFSYPNLTPENLDSFLSYPEWSGAAESFKNQLSGLEPKNTNYSKFDVINALSTNNMINNSVQNRLNTSSGSIWVQTVYNNLKELENNGFSSSSIGLVLGADGRISDSFKIGAGVYVDGSEFSIDDSDIDVANYTGVVYGQYRKDAFYINGIFNYGISEYKELNDKNTIDGYSANLYVGYNITSGLVAEIGTHYTHVNPYDYKYSDNYHIKTEQSDYVTINPGIRYSKSIGIFNLSANLSASYLAYNDIGDRTEYLFDTYEFKVVRGEDKDKFGIEGGVNLGANLGVLYVNLGYDYVRSIYYSDSSFKLSARSAF